MNTKRSRLAVGLAALLVCVLASGCHNRDPLGLPFEEGGVIENTIFWGDTPFVQEATFFSKWVINDDVQNGGNSRIHTSCISNMGTPSMYADGGWNSLTTNAVVLRYQLGDTNYPYPFVNIGVGDTWAIYSASELNLDARDYDGFSFWLVGDGHKLRIKVGTIGNFRGTSSVDVGKPELYDWDFYGITIEKTPLVWTHYLVPFSALAREGWSGTPVELDLSHITKFEFQAASQVKEESGWFGLYKLELVEGIYAK
jgi:hypothetical protein